MTEQNAFSDLNVQEVLELIGPDEYSPEEAIEIEKRGKNRSSLIDALNKMIADPETEDDSDQEDTEEEPETVAEKLTVILRKNIKYNTERYKIGEELEIDADDYDAFQSVIVGGE